MSFITIYEQRFGVLKEELSTVSYVNYVVSNDMPIGEIQKYYYLTQYAISPTIIDNTKVHQYIVTNVSIVNDGLLENERRLARIIFSPPLPHLFDVESNEMNTWQLCANYGNGLILYESQE